MVTTLALHLTPAGERAIRSGHPWLFGEAITRQSRPGQAGDLAVLFDRKNRFLAVGLYDPQSPIRVRVLQSGRPTTIDQAWLSGRLQTAISGRASLQANPQTTGYRLVHGENDGLPGLVLDRYGGSYVLKLYTAAWLPHLPLILGGLSGIVPAGCLLLRLSRGVQAHRPEGEWLWGAGCSRRVGFLENGLQFEADLQQGQKTGFFFDHRDNRAKVEGLAAGKNVLNLFAYSGAFSLYAARGGAHSVVSQDENRLALQDAARHFYLNRHWPTVAQAKHDLLAGDAFEQLKVLAGQGRRFEMVIIDPPTFTKKQAEVAGALAAYGLLARLGLAVLRPGGVLVMASCSGRVRPDQFFQTIHQAARESGRELRELARTAHPLDHPVTFAEGGYLKCLFASVSEWQVASGK